MDIVHALVHTKYLIRLKFGQLHEGVLETSYPEHDALAFVEYDAHGPEANLNWDNFSGLDLLNHPMRVVGRDTGLLRAILCAVRYP